MNLARLKKKKHRGYILLDPRYKIPRIFYVGETTQPLAWRLNQHISETRNGKGGAKKHRRIKAILDAGYRPIIVGTGEADATRWQLMEQGQIGMLRKWNVKLVNEAAGGLGQHGTHHSAEVRQKISVGVSRHWKSDKD